MNSIKRVTLIVKLSALIYNENYNLLTYMKGYYIIIRGPLGAGKTTLSKRIAKDLHGQYISIDAVLEKYGLDTSTNGNGIPVENFLKANSLIFDQVSNVIASGGVVVIDGNFYHREQLDHIIKTLGEPYYAFTLKCSVESCVARDYERVHSYGEDATRAVYEMVSAFDFGKIIDANRTINEEINEILSYVLKHA